LNGDDLRRDPLEVRKATLASILAKARPGSSARPVLVIRASCVRGNLDGREGLLRIMSHTDVLQWPGDRC
jgi:hypothetical protein